MAYEDSRLVDLYDIDNPDGPDHDFYRSLADEIGASSILDLGCGTGMLTVSLALAGRDVIGVDPSGAMLAFAHARPGGDRVDWIKGDSTAIPNADFDYAVMTGNVAQHLGQEEWRRALGDPRHGMRAGNTLAFETRNPLARAWDGWSSPEHAGSDDSVTPEVILLSPVIDPPTPAPVPPIDAVAVEATPVVSSAHPL